MTTTTDEQILQNNR